MEQKFYRCKCCGQIVAMVEKKKCPIYCCNQEMEELVCNMVDASSEKHVPVVSVENNVITVKVGSVTHPMVEEHYIEWISITTNKGNQRKTLRPNEEPVAKFALLDGEEVLTAYAYCNLHSLWANKLK